MNDKSCQASTSPSLKFMGMGAGWAQVVASSLLSAFFFGIGIGIDIGIDACPITGLFIVNGITAMPKFGQHSYDSFKNDFLLGVFLRR